MSQPELLADSRVLWRMPRGLPRCAGSCWWTCALRFWSGRVRHSAWDRWLWRRWFAHDGVRLDPERLGALEAAMPEAQLLERRGSVPYLPGVTAPYYVFLGRNPAR